ncbi:MAG: T9SS type A sorting domain-containing protein [Myroides sp.]|nr:T9SS type A sorting domain-containing protein [Myroides sp.]
MQAVGILYGYSSNEITQVAKAWYAVGIGNGLASTQNHEMQTKLNIYPNPVSGNKVFIDSSLEEATAVEMFDMTRKQVAPKRLDYKTTIYVSACKTGIYILKFKSISGEYAHKLMIK